MAEHVAPRPPHPAPVLLVVSGPSGAGKGTLTDHVLTVRPDVARIAGVTTRSPRSGERDGDQWRFVTDREMDALVAAGALVDLREKFGARYGFERTRVVDALTRGHALIETDIHTLGLLRKLFPCFAVLVTAPSRDERRRRLTGRGVTAAELEARLDEGRHMLRSPESYDTTILNDDLSTAQDKLIALVDRNAPFSGVDITARLLAGTRAPLREDVP